MSEIMLKPCPFCGKEILMDGTVYNINTHGEPRVYCANCGATGPNDVSYGRADEMWNLRRPEEALRDRIAQLEAHLKDRDTWLKNSSDYIRRLLKENAELEKALSIARDSAMTGDIYRMRQEIEIAELKTKGFVDKFEITQLEDRIKELEAEVKSWESTR